MVWENDTEWPRKIDTRVGTCVRGQGRLLHVRPVITPMLEYSIGLTFCTAYHRHLARMQVVKMILKIDDVITPSDAIDEEWVMHIIVLLSVGLSHWDATPHSSYPGPLPKKVAMNASKLIAMYGLSGWICRSRLPSHWRRFYNPIVSGMRLTNVVGCWLLGFDQY